MSEIIPTVYQERTMLLALLAKHYPSNMAWDNDGEVGFESILNINLPSGQASWHIEWKDLFYLSHIPFSNEYVWDGHTTQEKYNRVMEEAVSEKPRWAEYLSLGLIITICVLAGIGVYHVMSHSFARNVR